MKQHIITFIFFFHCTISFSQITSTFDTDDEGWTFLNSTTSIPATFNNANGNPGGYISVTYASNTTTTTQNWIAPTKFLGNHLVKSLGMNLKFDLQQSPVAGTNSNVNGDVRIENGGNVIVYSLPAKPALATGWSSYTVKLDETQGWRVNRTDGVLATREQIKAVLKNVTSIEFRGTYVTNAANTSGLDNVILEQRTLMAAPIATSLSATSGKPGDVITINGSGFEPNILANTVYFGGVKASIQNATNAQLVVVVPQGASYGPITIINNTTGLSTQTLKPFNPLFDGGGRIIPASFALRFDIATIEIEGFFAVDIDGDGWDDLAVTNNNADDAIDIYRNLGLGGQLSAASFDTKVTFTTPALGGSGTNGAGLWFADLDGDGKLDAITSNSSSAFNSVFITLRNTSVPGTISFEAPEYWPGNSDETPIALVADLDGDGRPELMGGEGSLSSTAFTYFWANQNISTPGDIEFGSPLGFFNGTVINGFGGATAGDLNGDGKTELIITQNGKITILQNTSTPGVPSFQNAFTIPINHYNVLTADLNLDGKNDLIYKTSDKIHIRLNNDTDGVLSDTDFAAPIILTGDLSNYGSVSIADINGDGRIDILSTDQTDVGVFENVYRGGVFDATAFIAAYQYNGGAANSYPASPIARDLNRDGKPDLLFGTTNGTNRIAIFENKNVIAPIISLNTVSPLKGAVGSTVTITGSNFSTTLSENKVRFGTVEATVLTASTSQLTVTVPPGAALGLVSVTRDNLTARYHLPFVPTFGPGVVFDNTHFSPPVNFTLTTADYDIAVGDLNRDGKPDVIAEGQTFRAYSFLNTHTGGAISTTSLTANDTTANSTQNPVLIDFDEDGFLDIISINGVYRNVSSISKIDFAPLTNLSSGSNHSIGDFNRDGKTDVLGANGTNISIAENRSIQPGPFITGTYATLSSNFNYPKPATGGGTAAADFDNDGWKDFVATNPGTDNVTVWRNNGEFRISTTEFTALPVIAVGDNPGRIYEGDLDVDGKMDLVIYYSNTTTSQFITVLHNQSTPGNISFNRFDYSIGVTATVAHISDLDGDGKPEILVTSETSDQFFILKNTSTPGVMNASSFATPFATAVNNPRGLASGDLNADGKPEIIISSAPNALLVYENLIPSGPTITVSTQPTSTAVCNGVAASFSLTAAGTTNLTYQWQKFDGSVFNNISNTGGYTGTTTSTLNINTSGNFGSGDYRCLIKGDLAPDKFSNTVTLTVNVVPAAPTANGNSNCIPAAITLNASGGTNGQYRWYDAANVLIAGQTNSTYVTPVISTTTNYSVAINNGFCESTKTTVTATIQPLAKPTLTSSQPITNNAINLCAGENVTLTAPVGFPTYTWSNGASSQQITVNINGVFSFTVTDGAGCISPSSDPVTLIVNPFPLAAITVNGIQLSASSGDSYQWYHNGNPIVGAVSQTFEYNVLEYGVYQVEVTENGCTATSTDFIYLITDYESQMNGLNIYPNPVENTLHVESKAPFSISVYTSEGKLLKETQVESNKMMLDFVDLPASIYVLQIKTEKEIYYKRIRKKN